MTDESRQGRIDSEAARTLSEIDSLGSIDVGPYFFQRLQARLGSPDQVSSRGLGRLAPALLALVFVANILTGLVALQDQSAVLTQTRENAVDALANEYLLTGSATNVDIASE